MQTIAINPVYISIKMLKQCVQQIKITESWIKRKCQIGSSQSWFC